jgi:ABC-type sugar transport system permease subunit
MIEGQLRNSFLFRRKKILPYLLVSPYLIFVIVFVLFPVFFCFFLTFHKWNIISPMLFIGPVIISG